MKVFCPKRSTLSLNAQHSVEFRCQNSPRMLYAHATLITVNPAREILLDGAILVRGETIAEIDKSDVLISRYPDEECRDLTGRILIPGLINTHMHTAQTLIRGTYSSSLIPISISHFSLPPQCSSIGISTFLHLSAPYFLSATRPGRLSRRVFKTQQELGNVLAELEI